jgi:streptogramin lyase
VNGTGSDTMVRFNPETETFTEYRMPTRVTYTREVEFDQDGDVWVCNSNYPTRHIENRHGSVIQVQLGGKS